jgi:hypothetical protein
LTLRGRLGTRPALAPARWVRIRPVYEALAESGIHPDWIAGISIGGINAGHPPNSAAPKGKILLWDQFDSTCPALPAKRFRYARRANHLYTLAPSRPDKRGVSRSSRTLMRDAVDAAASSALLARGRMVLSRTAKSCGPDASTPASSFAEVSVR